MNDLTRSTADRLGIDAATIWDAALALLLVALCSLPFLLGDQPSSLVSVEETGNTNDQGDAVKQIVLALLYAGVAVALLLRARRVVWGTASAWLAATIVWAFCTSLWAYDSSVSLRRCVALSGSLALGALIATRWPIQRMHRQLLFVSLALFGASLALAVVAPASGLDPEGRLRGVFSHKNSLGGFASLALVNAVCGLWQGGPAGTRRLAIGVAMLSVACLAIADSATSTVASGISIAVLLATCRRPSGSRLPALVALGTLLFFAVSFPWLSSGLADMAGIVGRDSDFSGRKLVWTFCWDFVSRRPWTGFGYGAFWNSSAGLAFYRWAHFPVPHAHNGPLQVLLDIGAIGLGFVMAAIVSLVLAMCRADGFAWRWTVGYLALVLGLNAMEPHLLAANDLFTVILAYACVRAGWVNRAEPEHRRSGA